MYCSMAVLVLAKPYAYRHLERNYLMHSITTLVTHLELDSFYSLIRKAQKQGRKEMTLLLDEVDKIKPRSELSMLLNLLEGNEIHKVVKKVEYHIKLRLRV